MSHTDSSLPEATADATTSTMTGGEIFAAQLVAEGVEKVFAVPGIQLDYAVDGLAQHSDTIEFVTARHEQGAAYMADGYARVSDKPGVCLIVPGPGLLNAGAALSTAYATNSRVVCITGQIPSHTIGKGLGMLHEINDQSALLKSLTKWSGIARTPEEIPGVLREAFHQVMSGRPQPVGVEIPPDVLQAVMQSGDVTILTPTAPDVLTPAQQDIDDAARLLAQAERPAIMAGGGVHGSAASEALRLFAERLGAPVVVTRNGKGAIDERHPLAATRLMGRTVLDEADVVLSVGTRFVTLAGQPQIQGAGRVVIGLNASEADLAAPRDYAVAIHSDAEAGLRALTDAVAAVDQSREGQTWLDLTGLRAAQETQLAAIDPQRAWLSAIREALPEDGVLVEELTQVGYAARLAYPVYEPRTYISPGYQGTLGYGFPTGLGAAVGAPHTQVVSINGDGGFGWALQELSTAAKYGIELVTVVFRNDRFENVQRIQQDTFGRTIGVDLANPDFVALAESFGVKAARVTSPAELAEQIRAARGTNEPLFIEVPVDEFPSPWAMIQEPAIGPRTTHENASNA